MKQEKQSARPVELRVFRNHNVVNTFLIIKNFIVEKASKIIIECWDQNGDLMQASEILNKRGSGLLTYNDTINTQNHTLRSARYVRDGIINQYQLTEGQELKAKLTVFSNGVHLYSIQIPSFD